MSVPEMNAIPMNAPRSNDNAINPARIEDTRHEPAREDAGRSGSGAPLHLGFRPLALPALVAATRVMAGTSKATQISG
ncbi:MAG: hypothetical protein JJU21_18570 [Salinarimonas sp.]|nr:hypothetical protein [Salinarimonas sp.]